VMEVHQDAKGQVRAVDVVASHKGRDIILLRGRGSDRAQAVPHPTTMCAIADGVCGGPGGSLSWMGW
jgi:hypothetical protein